MNSGQRAPVKCSNCLSRALCVRSRSDRHVEHDERLRCLSHECGYQRHWRAGLVLSTVFNSGYDGMIFASHTTNGGDHSAAGLIALVSTNREDADSGLKTLIGTNLALLLSSFILGFDAHPQMSMPE